MLTFSNFLLSMREKLFVLQSSLVKGICSESFLSRIESGERKAPQLLREYLLGRLNIPIGNFHDYLQSSEYEAWELRQSAIYRLLCGKGAEAVRFIDKYEKSLSSNDNISRQFCIYARAQVELISGKRLGEILYLYEGAVKCSMKHLLKDFESEINDARLCIQEYCILLEYLAARADSFGAGHIKKAEAELDKISSIIDKIMEEPSYSLTIAEIFPLAAYLYSSVVAEYERDCSVKYAKNACSYCLMALEYMRVFGKTYYFKEIMNFLEGYTDSDCSVKERYLEYKHFYDVLECIYKERSQDFVMATSAYIFVERGAHCIGNVILKRRKMLGITQGQLRADICSEKTMYRIENGKSSIQDYIFKMLYERLNLVPEYMHGEIIADKPEAFEIYRQVKEANNNGDYDKLEELLVNLKQLIKMDCTVNRQCWSRTFNNYLRATGQITDEKYCRNIKKLLSFSVDDIDNTEPENVYLNDAEIMLVHNLSILDKKNRRKYLEIVIAAIDAPKRGISLMTNYNLNAFILSYYASELGNEKSYKNSGAIGNWVIDMGLRLRNLGYIADNIYNSYWNDCKEGNAFKSQLRECLEISRFVRNEGKERFFKAKLNNDIGD